MWKYRGGDGFPSDGEPGILARLARIDAAERSREDIGDPKTPSVIGDSPPVAFTSHRSTLKRRNCKRQTTADLRG